MLGISGQVSGFVLTRSTPNMRFNSVDLPTPERPQIKMRTCWNLLTKLLSSSQGKNLLPLAAWISSRKESTWVLPRWANAAVKPQVGYVSSKKYTDG